MDGLIYPGKTFELDLLCDRQELSKFPATNDVIVLAGVQAGATALWKVGWRATPLRCPRLISLLDYRPHEISEFQLKSFKSFYLSIVWMGNRQK